MKNMSKAQASKVASQLAAKAQSWGQVAKQLSGIKGKVAFGKENMTIHEAFVALGVHTKTNKYTANDLALAWSERLKEGKAMHTEKQGLDNSWRCPLIVKAVPMVVEVDGEDFKLFELTDKGYKPIRKQILSRVVKAEDKEDKTDTVVNANIVLKGLVQSMFVDETLQALHDNEADMLLLTEAYIETERGTFERVVKNVAKDVWSIAEEVEVVVTVEEKPKSGKKSKNSKKAA